MKRIDKIKLWFTNVNKLEAVNDKLFLYKDYLIDRDKNVLLHNVNVYNKLDDKHIVLNDCVVIDCDGKVIVGGVKNKYVYSQHNTFDKFEFNRKINDNLFLYVRYTNFYTYQLIDIYGNKSILYVRVDELENCNFLVCEYKNEKCFKILSKNCVEINKLYYNAGYELINNLIVVDNSYICDLDGNIINLNINNMSFQKNIKYVVKSNEFINIITKYRYYIYNLLKNAVEFELEFKKYFFIVDDLYLISNDGKIIYNDLGKVISLSNMLNKYNWNVKKLLNEKSSEYNTNVELYIKSNDILAFDKNKIYENEIFILNPENISTDTKYNYKLIIYDESFIIDSNGNIKITKFEIK